MFLEEITKEIIGSAYTVYNQMGFGYLELVYEKCMLIELGEKNLKVEAQTPIAVQYKGNMVGNFIADIVVDEMIIVELKSVSKLVKAHEVQLVNYLVATGKPLGLLINFGEKTVEVRRLTKKHS
jgi:GxxExxY protein